MGRIDSPRTTGRGFRRLSFILSLVGVAALFSTLASIPTEGLPTYSWTAGLASALFFGSNLYFFLARFPKRWMAIVQSFEIATIGVIAAVVSDPETYGGMILVAVSVVLLAKHGVLKTRPAMFAALGVAVILDTAGSHLINDAPIRLILAMAAVSVGVFAVIYYAFYDEIISLLKDVSALRDSAKASERDLIALRRDLARARIQHQSAEADSRAAQLRVEALERMVASFEAVASPVNLEQFRLSRREAEVLQTLVEIRGRNRDIGEALGINERTVKSHIYRICNKVGVDTRLELVELFRWNWPQGEPTDDSK